jgi:hypothetical protein
VSRRLDREWLTTLAAVVRAEVLRHLRPDSCIATTRLLLDVLARERITAYALAVDARVANMAAERLLAAGAGADSPDGRAAWEAAGAWVVAIERGEAAPDRWAGHLVAVAERRFLVDAALDQAARPERGIAIMGPVVAPVGEPFLRGREGLVGQLGATTVRYRARPGDRSYRAAPDWADPTRRAAALAAVQARLAAGGTDRGGHPNQ